MPKMKISVLSALISIASLIGFGTWAFRLFEDWTWAQSFYFAVSTLSTVGYGDDIVPSTDSARVFTAIYILIGVGIVFTSLTVIGTKYLDSQENRINGNISKKLQDKQKRKEN